MRANPSFVRVGAALILSGTLLVAGCATDVDRTRAEGAGAGALVGAIFGNLASGTNKEKGTVAGALVGAVVGAAIGDNVAKRKAAYASREDYLQAMAAQAQQTAQQARRYNEQLRHDIAVLEHSQQRLQSEVMASQARHRLASDSRQRMLAMIQRTDNAIVAVRNEIAVQQAAIREDELQQRRQQTQQQTTASAGVRLVSMGVRDLQIQERELERAQAQLRLIDSRRAY